MDERMGHQENKINTLTDTTEKIMELVQRISKSTITTSHPTPSTATTKPTYTSVTHTMVPAKHMDVITRSKSKTRHVLIKAQPDHIQNLDERTLVTKANLALKECVDPPRNTEFISAKKV